MNMIQRASRLALPLFSLIALAACGGGSDDKAEEGFTQGYVQFYNGAANSANSTFTVDNKAAGSAVFGDASNMFAIEPGSYKYQLKNATNSSLIKEADITLNKGDKTLLLMAGDAANPSILSLTHAREEKFDDQFRVFVANLSSNYDKVDIYTAAEADDFSKAILLESVATKTITTTGKMLKRGKYKLYITAAGSKTPFFEAAAYNFQYTASYVMVVRDKLGPLQQQVSLDIVGNSSAVDALEHRLAKGQVRIYNSLDNQEGQIAINNLPVADLVQDTLTDYIQLDKNDYSIAVLNENNQLLLNNVLLTINAGQSKSVLLFRDAEQKVGLVNFTEKNLPQIHEHEINVANLVPDFKNLHFYFVRQNETIESAKFHVKALEFKKYASLVLPKDFYSISLVHVADNGTISLLDKTDTQQLEAGKNYILAAEPSATAPSGYKITLVK
ncbi:DUF4397 domain-containing protein [Rheinheimera sp. 1928-s]|uniref:DUF4397 domain-containing protein n=1 Tax=Rheinheimera sp. 1928-s TaxID=3033803 RepID=UPI00260B5E89|nr:DUF4397 domain-containing protein [Rheinheimera sp. 1928-s]MDF3126301.1 DUF4397 domain-containing protein [Rheinheimera sp. 1928-s]